MYNSSNYRWDKKQILVVEDDESSAFLLGEILDGTGATVNFSTDGKAAVAYMRENPGTDLILMDVLLPEMDGFSATRKIKSFARDVIIIAQTAYAYSVDLKQAMDAGCDALITKPVVPSILLDKIDSFLS